MDFLGSPGFCDSSVNMTSILFLLSLSLLMASSSTLSPYDDGLSTVNYILMRTKTMTDIVRGEVSSGSTDSTAICHEVLPRSSAYMENARTALASGNDAAAILVQRAFTLQKTCLQAIEENPIQTAGGEELHGLLLTLSENECQMKLSVARVVGHPGTTPTAGTYKEYVTIASTKPKIILQGAGKDRTIISGSRSNGTGYATFYTATLVNDADGFITMDLTVENTAGPKNYQAIAVQNGGDHSIFYRCSFKGYQDTLGAYLGNQFYRECDIYGTVDIIFGYATAILQNCNIYPRKPLYGQYNTITAQGRSCPTDTSGFSIHNCIIKASEELQPVQKSVKTYLGRPWRKYSRTIYMQTFMGELIAPEGWMRWNDSNNTLYYAEYSNSGPGSSTSGRVKWDGYHVLSREEADRFTLFKFTDGANWVPNSKVPYATGLV